MQQEDDLKALENIVQFARGLGVFFLVLHVYWLSFLKTVIMILKRFFLEFHQW